MTDADDLAIVIPTRRRWPILRRTLDALGRQTVGGAEVVLVVDGEDEVVPEDIAARDLRIVVQAHAGPGAARNRGLAATDRPLVLFLGDDMVPTPQLVAAHASWHRRRPEPEVAVLGHVDWHPEVADDRILRWLDWSATQFDYVNLAGAGGEDVGFGRFYSSNVSLKRELIERVGGFDEDFIYYYEDLDLGYRLGEAGMALIYEPAALAHHLQHYDLDDVRRRFEGIGLGERLMADVHDWFEPFFLGRIQRAVRRSPARRLWTRVVDLLPRGSRLRRHAEREANAWYLQQVAPDFLAAWDRAAHVTELRRYLGDDFETRLVIHHDHALEAEAAAASDEVDFYRTSRSYLYDLTAFAMSGAKDPYLAELRRQVREGARLLDYGCGIGTDGLRLLSDGYRVSFADFGNPSTAYLRWRLAQRGLDARVYDIERDDIPGGFEAAYAFDVIEHVDDPVGFLERLEERAALVIVNLLEHDGSGHDHEALLHRTLPIDDLVERARQRGLLSHTVHHGGRSHLLVYRGSAQSGG